MTHHIMLDLETMGKGPEAAIVSIGAVEVLVDEGTLGREFYAPVDLQSAMEDLPAPFESVDVSLLLSP